MVFGMGPKARYILFHSDLDRGSNAELDGNFDRDFDRGFDKDFDTDLHENWTLILILMGSNICVFTYFGV